jgi:hypothetical protein
MNKFLAWAIGVSFGFVGLALLLGNHIVAVGNVVDGHYFQLVLTIMLCAAITLALFGWLEKSTASIKNKIGKWTLTLGGPIAGFVALVWLILPSLTPTTRLSLYFRDGTVTRPGQVYRIPNGLDVLLVLPEGMLRGKSSETDVVFPYLPKGQDMAVNLDSPRYRLVGLFPESCSARNESEFKLKAGCRSAYLCIADAVGATFTNLRDLPPINLGLPNKVTLKLAVQALASELQAFAVARDRNAVVSTPNWNEVQTVADQAFAWKKAPDGSGTCVVASTIEASFNAANPKTPIDLIVRERGIAVQLKSQNRKREDDICSGPPPTLVDPIKLAAACDH